MPFEEAEPVHYKDAVGYEAKLETPGTPPAVTQVMVEYRDIGPGSKAIELYIAVSSIYRKNPDFRFLNGQPNMGCPTNPHIPRFISDKDLVEMLAQELTTLPQKIKNAIHPSGKKEFIRHLSGE